jgi:leucyl aminopeptidase
MEVSVKQVDVSQVIADAVVLPVYEDDKLPGGFQSLDSALGGYLTGLMDKAEIKGKYKDINSVYSLGKLPASKIVTVGLGKKSELTAEKVRVALAETCKALRRKNAVSLYFCLPPAEGVLATAVFAQAAVEGALLGCYEFKKYFSAAAEKREIKALVLAVAEAGQLAAAEAGCRKGRIIAEAAILARDLSNEPANYLTPTNLAEAAQSVAGQYGIDIKVLERDQMAKLGMGGLIGVSQGSIQLPKFIMLNYKGRSADETDIALVGKGITFDSGGISLKPSDNMGEMKGDMAGGASVLAAVSAAAQLKLAVNVTAIIPATENLPSGTALKPGDVIKIMNGKSVEIISTDAEGRLVLADALCYARQMGAKRIIDIATLTGSCHVALGDVCTGAFTNDEDFVQLLISCGQETGECLWQLPMNDEYRELNRSDVADLKNSGGRYGGAISAAWFLREFVEGTPWIHLDIAGTSTIDKERGYLIKGNTGVPARTLISLVERLAERLKL